MRRRIVQDALMGICTIALFIAVGVMMVTTWAEHPAEQTINGVVYMESLLS